MLWVRCAMRKNSSAATRLGPGWENEQIKIHFIKEIASKGNQKKIAHTE